MSDVAAGPQSKSYLGELVPGVWRLTGEVSKNPLQRINFTARVLVGAVIGRIEDLDGSLAPMKPKDILARDARQHIGVLAVDRGLQVPEDFVPPPRGIFDKQ